MRIILQVLAIIGCFATIGQPRLLDQKAGRKAQNLYKFLHHSASSQLLFGHQDDLAYGVDWWEEKNGSDVKSVTGKYPAVFGWDVGHLDSARNLDSVRFDFMIASIKKIYRMGGISTISWHMRNPATGQSSWSQGSSVSDILPGGAAHQKYLNKLDLFADFVRKCKVGFTKIPLVFRPFHEHNGGWFWWGKEATTEAEYIALWRFTIDYLKNEKRVHQLIYAFSPDRSQIDLDSGQESYLYGYPGDEYVDIIGLDNYWDLGHDANPHTSKDQQHHLSESIRLISSIAQAKNKVAALTECGNDRIVPKDWYMERLLNPIHQSNGAIAWVLVWRNATREHFYVPVAGHHNEDDFKAFERHRWTAFLSDIKNPYRK